MGHSQDERIGVTAGAQRPLGYVHGELTHRIDLGVKMHAANDQTQVLSPAVEPRWLAAAPQLRTWARG